MGELVAINHITPKWTLTTWAWSGYLPSNHRLFGPLVLTALKAGTQVLPFSSFCASSPFNHWATLCPMTYHYGGMEWIFAKQSQPFWSIGSDSPEGRHTGVTFLVILCVITIQPLGHTMPYDPSLWGHGVGICQATTGSFGHWF